MHSLNFSDVVSSNSIRLVQFVEQVTAFVISLIKKFLKFVKLCFGLFGLIPIIIISYPIAFVSAIAGGCLTYILAKQVSSVRKTLESIMKEYSFEKVKNINKDVNWIINMTEWLLTHLVDAKKIYLPTGLYIKYFREILEDFKSIEALSSSMYKFDKENLFASDEEFNQHRKEWSDLSDLWNFDTPDSDYKTVFNHKKSIF